MLCMYICNVKHCVGGAPNYYPNSFNGPVDNPKYAQAPFKLVSNQLCIAILCVCLLALVLVCVLVYLCVYLFVYLRVPVCILVCTCVC